MVDRVTVLAGIAPLTAFTSVAGKKFNDQLTKAIAIGMASLPLTNAHVLPEALRDEVGEALRGLLTFTELKAVAKLWEPRRKLDADETQTQLAGNLEALLFARRPPYSPPAYSLADARSLESPELASLLQTLASVAPIADLKKLAKSWDKFNSGLQALPRKQLIEHLEALAKGVEQPTPKPKSKAR